MHYDRFLFIIIMTVFISNTDSINTQNIDVLNRHDILKRDLDCPHKCPNGLCVPKLFLCDGDRDCVDGSDEDINFCKVTCEINQFTCNNGECIDLLWKCDGETDCEDNSDEHNCTSKVYSSNCSAEVEFDCGDNHCIPLIKVCDGVSDCETFEDEFQETCPKYGCHKNNGGCAHNCTISPIGRVCSCLNGYTLEEDTLCKDIDECKNASSCSQLCLNEKGSFKCYCADGYEIYKNNPRHCKSIIGHGYILIARKVDVRKLNLAHHEVVKVIDNTSIITAMDFDFKTETIFWFDLTDRTINKVSQNKNDEKHVIIDNVMIVSLAYDWIYKRIYMANRMKKSIDVINIGGSTTTHLTLIDKHVDAQAIVLHPMKGLMFWIDSYFSMKIKRAWMDGSHAENILSFQKGLPVDLVLDFIKERIYWVDNRFHSISSCNYDGSDAKLILMSTIGFKHAFSIALFENSVYWTDVINQKLYKANKLTGEVSSFGYINTNDFPIIHVYHQLRQPDGTNYCDHANCSHHCFPVPKPYYGNSPISCACPDDYFLSYDNSTCTKKSCGDGLYACRNSKCISDSFVCDGDIDCDEGEDESDCGEQTCAANEFTCNNGQCIQYSWKCNGELDCIDASDEKDCKEVCMEETQIQCETSHECIDINWICDHKEDCLDGSDESQCPEVIYTCSDKEYACKNASTCLPLNKICDGTQDCPHKDDEDPNACMKKNSNASIKCDSASEFDCGNSTCISMSKVCDKHPDCPNSSDEPSSCNVDLCKDNNGGCAHKCIHVHTDYYCECYPGYELINGKSCEDKNECHVPGACSQICLNTVGSFSCQCFPGFIIEPHRPNSCKAMVGRPYLIFNRRHDIRMLELHSYEMTDVMSNLRHVLALDYDYKTKGIFWSDDNLKIYRMSIDKNQQVIHQFPEDIMDVDHIAVDWIYNHLYWTNAKTGTIELSDFDGKFHTVLIKDRNGIPKSITLDPTEGLMFWTDQSTSIIKRAGMDGSHSTIIVEHELMWPADLTLDLILRKVYWIDGHLKTISSCEYDGANRRTILTTNQINHPISISIFEDWMYWTDARIDKGKIYKANKFHGKDLKEVIKTSEPGVVHVFHPYKQPNGTNHCGLDNGNCSHLCLPIPRITPLSPRVSCACPLNSTLMHDRFTCIHEETSAFVETTNSGSIAGTVIAVFTILLTIGIILGFVIYKKDTIQNHFKNNSRFNNPRYSVTDGDNFSIYNENQE